MAAAAKIAAAVVRVPDQWQATLRLAEYQAGADETDADQRTLQRGGRPVRREYADD